MGAIKCCFSPCSFERSCVSGVAEVCFRKNGNKKSEIEVISSLRKKEKKEENYFFRPDQTRTAFNYNAQAVATFVNGFSATSFGIFLFPSSFGKT